MKAKFCLKTAFFAIAFLAFANISNAQAIIDHSFDTWWSNINQYKINDNWYASSELHIRRANGVQDWQQFLFRPAINYKLNKQVEFAVGYTYVLSYPYGEQPITTRTPEHNVWEQVTLKQGFDKLKISHRYRLENRFIGTPTTTDGINFSINGTTYAQRFRYRITASYPISEKWFVKGFEEIWMNLNNNNFLPSSLNQNWLYGGFGYKFSDKINLEAGYMNQLIKKGDNVHFENNPTTQVTLGYKFGK